MFFNNFLPFLLEAPFFSTGKKKKRKEREGINYGNFDMNIFQPRESDRERENLTTNIHYINYINLPMNILPSSRFRMLELIIYELRCLRCMQTDFDCEKTSPNRLDGILFRFEGPFANAYNYFFPLVSNVEDLRLPPKPHVKLLHFLIQEISAGFSCQAVILS